MCAGITLEGANSSEVWDPEHKNDDADGGNQHFGVDQKLIIKMVSLLSVFLTLYVRLYRLYIYMHSNIFINYLIVNTFMTMIVSDCLFLVFIL